MPLADLSRAGFSLVSLKWAVAKPWVVKILGNEAFWEKINLRFECGLTSE